MTDVRAEQDQPAELLPQKERPRRSNQPSALTKWLSLVLVGSGAIALAVRASGPVVDPDTWWHLRLGDDFRYGWSLSNPGQLSPFADKAWVPTQWLSEVVMSYVNSIFGLSGIAWLTGAAVLALATALFAVCRQEGTTLAASVTVMLALVGVTASISTRPQLMSFILLAVYTGAWLRTARDLRARWWLVPVSGVWACLHGMWFTGTLVGIVVVVGMSLDRRVSLQKAGRLSLVPLLGIVAAALTPVGPKLLLAPITVSKLAPFITEWQPPNFRQPCALFTATMLMLIMVSWSRGHQTSWSHILLFILACGWTALSLRTVAIGAVMAAPLLSAAMHEWITTRPVLRMAKRERNSVVAGVVTGLVLLTVLAQTRSASQPPLPPSVDIALAGLPAQTVVFNDDALGGWLEWRHPNVAPVSDTMEDAYEPAYLIAYIHAVSLAPGWEKFVRRTGARYALLYPGSPLAFELRRHWGWRPVASGPSAVLLAGRRL